MGAVEDVVMPQWVVGMRARLGHFEHDGVVVVTGSSEIPKKGSVLSTQMC